MTALANAFRMRYGTSDKLGISDMITLLGSAPTQPPEEQINPNLLKNTDDYADVGGTWKIFQWSGLSGTFNGLTVANLNSGGIITQPMAFQRGPYVFSCFVRISDGSPSGSVDFKFNDGDTKQTSSAYVTSDWKRYFVTMDSLGNYNGRFEVSPDGTRIQIAGQKVETGSVPTAYVTKSGQKVTASIVDVGRV